MGTDLQTTSAPLWKLIEERTHAGTDTKEDVFGHEVNLASKLGEDTAKGHEILVTRAAREAAGEIAGVAFETYAVEFAGETSCFRVKY